MLLELCKGVHCVDLDESFQTNIYLQNFVSIQPRTSSLKFARSPRTGALGGGARRGRENLAADAPRAENKGYEYQ